jgi:hypothetical protein
MPQVDHSAPNLGSKSVSGGLDDADLLGDEVDAVWKLNVPAGDHIVHVVAAGYEWGESWAGYRITASVDVIFLRKERQASVAWVAAAASNSWNPKDPWPSPDGSPILLDDSNWFDEEIPALRMILPRMAGL